MKISRLAVMCALPLALAACGAQNNGSADGAAGAPVAAVSADAAKSQFEVLAKDAKGFTVGSLASTRHLYVMFDPQCPHCGELWSMTKPMLNQARFTWVPVHLMRKVSAYQGAALIGAANPAATMDAHELELAKGQGGMAVDEKSVPADLLAAIEKNTSIFTGFGATSVPFIVGKHAKTGEVVTISGARPPAELAQAFGWSDAQP